MPSEPEPVTPDCAASENDDTETEPSPVTVSVLVPPVTSSLTALPIVRPEPGTFDQSRWLELGLPDESVALLIVAVAPVTSNVKSGTPSMLAVPIDACTPRNEVSSVEELLSTGLSTSTATVAEPT